MSFNCDENILNAAKEFFSRDSERSKPPGSFDKAKRWWPADSEEMDCCSEIRRPTSYWPRSLMVHCKSVLHISNLYQVDNLELKRLCLRLKRLGAEDNIEKAIAHMSAENEAKEIVRLCMNDVTELPIQVVSNNAVTLKQKMRRI